MVQQGGGGGVRTCVSESKKLLWLFHNSDQNRGQNTILHHKWCKQGGGGGVRKLGSRRGFLGLRSDCDNLLSLPDHLVALLLRHGEDRFNSPGELFEDERMGAAKFILPLLRPQGVPALHGDPVSLGEIGRCTDTVDLKQFVKALCAAMEPEDAEAGAVEVGHGEHFAANVAIAGPVDKMMAPVHRLRRMRKARADRSDALVIHGPKCKASRSVGPVRISLRTRGIGVRARIERRPFGWTPGIWRTPPKAFRRRGLRCGRVRWDC